MVVETTSRKIIGLIIDNNYMYPNYFWIHCLVGKFDWGSNCWDNLGIIKLIGAI
jgi:hypothetical protein